MDQTLFSLINGAWTSPGLDRLMAVLSDFSFWLPFLLVATVGVALFGCFKSRAMLLVLLVVVGVTDGGVVNALKHWANRPRPYQVEAARVVQLRRKTLPLRAVFLAPVVKVSKPETGPIIGRSFPSGHTTDNFAAAAVLALFYRRWGRLYFLVAAAVAYSRIYTGSHWPSDVLVSVFLGVGLGVLGTVALEASWRKWGGRLAPILHGWHPSLLNEFDELEENEVLI